MPAPPSSLAWASLVVADRARVIASSVAGADEDMMLLVLLRLLLLFPVSMIPPTAAVVMMEGRAGTADVSVDLLGEALLSCDLPKEKSRGWDKAGTREKRLDREVEEGFDGAPATAKGSVSGRGAKWLGEGNGDGDELLVEPDPAAAGPKANDQD